MHCSDIGFTNRFSRKFKLAVLVKKIVKGKVRLYQKHFLKNVLVKPVIIRGFFQGTHGLTIHFLRSSTGYNFFLNSVISEIIPMFSEDLFFFLSIYFNKLLAFNFKLENRCFRKSFFLLPFFLEFLIAVQFSGII